MISIQLDMEEWNRVLGILAQAPWNVVNPLLMKIGDQLRYQQAAGAAQPRSNGADPPTTGPFGEVGPPNQAKPQ